MRLRSEELWFEASPSKYFPRPHLQNPEQNGLGVTQVVEHLLCRCKANFESQSHQQKKKDITAHPKDICRLRKYYEEC
jgi:hypothetical protein